MWRVQPCNINGSSQVANVRGTAESKMEDRGCLQRHPRLRNLIISLRSLYGMVGMLVEGTAAATLAMRSAHKWRIGHPICPTKVLNWDSSAVEGSIGLLAPVRAKQPVVKLCFDCFSPFSRSCRQPKSHCCLGSGTRLVEETSGARCEMLMRKSGNRG